MRADRSRPRRRAYLAICGVILAVAVACGPPPPAAHQPTTTTTTAPPGLCTAGSYSTTGHPPCSPAPPGFFVDTVGATMATPCAAGGYQPSTGQASCVRAAIGSYVDGIARTAPTPCPAGTTTTTLGASSLSECVAVRAFTFNRTVGINTTSTTSAPFGSSVLSGVTASITINCSTSGPINAPWGGGILAHVSVATLTDIGTLPGGDSGAFTCGVSYPLTISGGPFSFAAGETLNVSTDLIPPPGTTLTFTVVGDLGGIPTQVL